MLIWFHAVQFELKSNNDKIKYQIINMQVNKIIYFLKLNLY